MHSQDSSISSSNIKVGAVLHISLAKNGRWNKKNDWLNLRKKLETILEHKKIEIYLLIFIQTNQRELNHKKGKRLWSKENFLNHQYQ